MDTAMLPQGALAMYLREKFLQALIHSQPVQLYHKGHCLYGADEPFRGLFVVVSGAVKHYRLTEEGEEPITGFCLPGEWCGLPDLSSGRYLGFAQALDTCSVCRFPQTLLADVLAEPHGRQEMYTLMSTVIRENKGRYYQISKARADVRFVMFILDLSRRFSRYGDYSREFHLPMTRGDIANYLGLTPETISREITRLGQCDLIHFNNRFITIRSPAKLEAWYCRG